MLIKGDINKPVLNGFVFIKDSEIDFYTNIIKNINSVIIFDFDHLEIKEFEAFDANSGNILLKVLYLLMQKVFLKVMILV